ncbi:DUF6207 family protein [Streptomyces flavidovirens]
MPKMQVWIVAVLAAVLAWSTVMTVLGQLAAVAALLPSLGLPVSRSPPPSTAARRYDEPLPQWVRRSRPAPRSRCDDAAGCAAAARGPAAQPARHRVVPGCSAGVDPRTAQRRGARPARTQGRTGLGQSRPLPQGLAPPASRREHRRGLHPRAARQPHRLLQDPHLHPSAWRRVLPQLGTHLQRDSRAEPARLAAAPPVDSRCPRSGQEPDLDRGTYTRSPAPGPRRAAHRLPGLHRDDARALHQLRARLTAEPGRQLARLRDLRPSLARMGRRSQQSRRTPLRLAPAAPARSAMRAPPSRRATRPAPGGVLHRHPEHHQDPEARFAEISELADFFGNLGQLPPDHSTSSSGATCAAWTPTPGPASDGQPDGEEAEQPDRVLVEVAATDAEAAQAFPEAVAACWESVTADRATAGWGAERSDGRWLYYLDRVPAG